MIFKEFDKVKLIQDVYVQYDNIIIPKGTEGIVMEIYSETNGDISVLVELYNQKYGDPIFEFREKLLTKI